MIASSMSFMERTKKEWTLILQLNVWPIKRRALVKIRNTIHLSRNTQRNMLTAIKVGKKEI